MGRGGTHLRQRDLLFYIRIFIGQNQPSIFGKGRGMNAAGMENAINLGKCRKKSLKQRKGTDEKAKCLGGEQKEGEAEDK
jgi:hypothetical protein